MDFYSIVIHEKKDGTLQIRPDWKVGRSEDLMTRGGAFYAIWDEERGLWSTDIYDVQRLVDADLIRFANEQEDKTGLVYSIARMQNNSSKLWDEFNRFLRNSGNSYHNLDEKLIFADTKVKKIDYASKRLPYSLNDGPHEAWDVIVGTLYSETERTKLEWAIGAIASGNSKFIQKFLVLYGPPGSGKSTVLNIIEKLFVGYTTVFDARELAGSNNSFATSAFRTNPLVAIQHDGDLSRIYDNTKLNSIVAHEIMPVNEKYKAPYEMRANAFLFMGTNVPVKISDAKSGIIRRLIDVVPTGKTIEHDAYHMLMDRIDEELGAIAHHCLKRYRTMGRNHYSNYRPTEMMLQTDVFYNFVESSFDVFKAQNGVTLKQAWSMYKEYCNETGIEKMLPQYKLREELKNYFYSFDERIRIDGQTIRSYYSGFKHLEGPEPSTEFPIKLEGPYRIEFTEGRSIFDEKYPGLPAQYAKKNGSPEKFWTNTPIVDGEQIIVSDDEVCSTVLSDLDTTKLHFVKVPENHIVIDFDLTDEEGNKSFERNLEEASKWPATYAEVSKSGKGIHLHYLYTGDVRELANVIEPGIEIKTLLGNSALRRQVTLSNRMNFTTLDGGLKKKEKPTIENRSIKSEKGIRELVGRNLQKKIHPGTKPSIDFIHKILEESYEQGIPYDIRDMRKDILTFAAKSTNHATQCMKIVQTMKFVGQNTMPESDEGDVLVFFDVEVYRNLLIVCWKKQGDDTVVRMINPAPEDIEPLFSMKLIGYNCRRYDNHILYARYLGYSLEELYHLSQKMINGGNNKEIFFGEAYNLSYTDIYDFSSKKQGLKRFQIDLELPHIEIDIPWDEEVPESRWKQIEEYCVNDVLSTEAVFEDRKQDFVARQILASLSGLSVNHTTQTHTAKIIFGDDKEPQRQFVYTDLSKEFPGYQFNGKDSTYRGEVTGEGGYVYAEPGIYENVALLDVASMHPTSIEQLNLFGPYTERFRELKAARMAIKHKDFESIRTLLDGKIGKFVEDDQAGLEDLAYALKIVINIVYGLTSARFPNAFRDNRNKDNIVAKRGALFMIDLKHYVQELGYQVVHIKTDSIKVVLPPDAPRGGQEIIELIENFGLRYGYDFEHEKTYEWFCLVNDAVYVARIFHPGAEFGEGHHDGHEWVAVGAQFQHPYVFKTLFTHEEIDFKDLCETKNVLQGTMYLEFPGDGVEEPTLVHVGRTGSFVPVEPGEDGGILWRIKDDNRYAVTGTKGWLWITREMAEKRLANDKLAIDMDYFEDLKRKALNAITSFDEVKGIDQFLVLKED